MADTTITSANSVFYLIVPSLFPSPVRLQGYATDRAFATDAVQTSEVMMGVDGRMTAGWTPMTVKTTISLQADSPSKDIFTNLIQYMKTVREILYISATLTLPSTQEVFTFTKGVLTSAKQIPDAQKVLQPQDYEITWESVNRAIL